MRDKARYRAYVRRKIERGLAALERGEVIPHEQVMKELRAVLARSSGGPRPAKTRSRQ